jgi:hypothetical protein
MALLSKPDRVICSIASLKGGGLIKSLTATTLSSPVISALKINHRMNRILSYMTQGYSLAFSWTRQPHPEASLSSTSTPHVVPSHGPPKDLEEQPPTQKALYSPHQVHDTLSSGRCCEHSLEQHFAMPCGCPSQRGAATITFVHPETKESLDDAFHKLWCSSCLKYCHIEQGIVCRSSTSDLRLVRPSKSNRERVVRLGALVLLSVVMWIICAVIKGQPYLLRGY